MKEKSKSLSILLNGIIVENPILVMLLGMCPTLAITNKQCFDFIFKRI